jgi:hypothetical protein
MKYATVTTVMGQELLNPPSVEGWHTGREWIDGGTMNERVNFAIDEISGISQPGIKEIVDRILDDLPKSPGALVDSCLELSGPVEVSNDTRSALMKFARSIKDLESSSSEQYAESSKKIIRMLKLIVSTTEYQFA